MADSEPQPIYRDAEWLEEEYHQNGKSLTQLADEADCDPKTIRRWMNKHGIERRERFRDSGPDVTDERLKDGEWLRRKYHHERCTLDDIADIIGVSDATIRDWMDRHGIERRDRSEVLLEDADLRLRDADWLEDQYWSEGKTLTEIGEECSVTYAAVQYWMEHHGIPRRAPSHAGGIGPDSPLRDADWLEHQYVDKMKTSSMIGELLGRDRGTVLNWLHRHDIEVRTPVVDYPKEMHPTYKGETSEYGPGWNQKKKEAIRERDGECQDCGMSNGEHLEVYGTGLHVHHIQPARILDDPEELNAPSNLVALCRECHLNKWDRIPFLAPDRR